jgi:hypothetical protein
MGYKQILTFLIMGFLFLTSCKTYYISPDSFKQQFAGIDSTKLKLVEMTGGGSLWVTDQYLANPITKIKCEDKNGNPAELENSPAIEIRFTYGVNNKKTSGYFDRVFVSDSIVTCIISRFIPTMRKTIPLNSITKIEVQNGGKNYKYVNYK